LFDEKLELLIDSINFSSPLQNNFSLFFEKKQKKKKEKRNFDEEEKRRSREDGFNEESDK
jgi:hypothetical protein